MNRLAVVLAADSATTFTYMGENGHEQRYFNGANKIFQLSNWHPVGVMIFGSADLLKVPWEVVIKDFRQKLGKKSFNDVDGYAKEFFAFIESSPTMFPAEVQQDAFLTAARNAAVDLVMTAEGDTPGERLAAVEALMPGRRQELDGVELLPCIGAEAPAEALAAHKDGLVAIVDQFLKMMGVTAPKDLGLLAEIGILEVFKRPSSHLGDAGLVFAGFGDHDVFPTMIEYRSYGIILGKHVHQQSSSTAIDHDLPAWLKAFAQTSMADTFSAGVGFDVYASTMVAVAGGLEALVEKLLTAAGKQRSEIANLTDMLDEARRGIGNAILDRARNEHAMPMRRVLAALPVDELAELAETLINLQSLKEKVTKPSATVGGPVDVAVITRSEGLVWIKRKHYFDSTLNSRYMHRQQSQH